MKTAFFSLIFMAITATGCISTSAQPLRGALYTNVSGPNHALPASKLGNKRGEACGSNVLGLVSWGDASIDTARKNGNITQVAAVDYQNLGFISIVYNKTCTIVSGT